MRRVLCITAAPLVLYFGSWFACFTLYQLGVFDPLTTLLPLFEPIHVLVRSNDFVFDTFDRYGDWLESLR